MKYILPLLFIINTACAQSVGDSVHIVPGKPLVGIEPDYFRKDWALGMHQNYIIRDMPGRTYRIYKIKKGIAYVKAPDKMINHWSPLKFKFDIEPLLQSQTIIIKKTQK